MTTEHDPSVPTLAALILDRKGDRSYAQLAALTDDEVSRQRWQQLASGNRVIEFPEPSTLNAIARALGVDVALVVLATARSIGMDVERGSDSDLGMLLPSTARKLTHDQRNALLDLIRSIVQAEERSDKLPNIRNKAKGRNPG